MLFIAQSNTLSVHHAITQQVHETWAKLCYIMKCTHCTVYWHTSHWVSETCHALLTICLLLQGLHMCFRCSEASHVSYILLKLCSYDSLVLLALLIILSAEIVYLFNHPVFVFCCMGVHRHSHKALPHADHSTTLRTYLRTHEALRWGHTLLQANESSNASRYARHNVKASN